MNKKKDIYFAHQVLGTLFSVTNKLQAHGDKYLNELSLRQMNVVGAIIHLPEGKATINNIARFMGTTKQSVKQIVDAMEKKAYLRVTESVQDRRAINAAFTPLGEEIIRKCAERNDEFIADVFKDFTKEDLEALLTLLKKLYRFDGIEQESFNEKMKYYQNPGKHSHDANRKD